MKKINLPLLGFIQAAGVLVYCGLVAVLINSLDSISLSLTPLIGGSIMLTLLVVSAAITGAIVFGYSIYLALKNNIKEAVYLFLFTILYLIGIIFVGIILMITIKVI